MGYVELWHVNPCRWSLEQGLSSGNSYLNVTCWVNHNYHAYIYIYIYIPQGTISWLGKCKLVILKGFISTRWPRSLPSFYVHVTVHRNKILFNKTKRPTNFPKFIFVKKLHVSGSSSAHHQDFSTVHLALVCVMQVWWQLSSTTRMEAIIKPAWHIPVPNVQWKTDDGQRNCPKHVEFLDKNKFGKITASLVLLERHFRHVSSITQNLWF